MTTTPTTSQIRLMQHSLGINADRREPFRNHFVAGAGHADLPDLEQLELLGLMSRRKLSDAWGGGYCYHVTEPGKAIAIRELPDEPKRTRYDEFLDAECGENFGEFICKNGLPHFETRYTGRGRELRMTRTSPGKIQLSGEWALTKKAAKASYKVALSAVSPHVPMRSRTDVYNCAGCGRFVGDAQRFSGNCAKCGTDNRP
jgi:hypothetical protein